MLQWLLDNCWDGDKSKPIPPEMLWRARKGGICFQNELKCYCKLEIGFFSYGIYFLHLRLKILEYCISFLSDNINNIFLYYITIMY